MNSPMPFIQQNVDSTTEETFLPAVSVGFVYYDEQWRQFAKVVKDWEALVAQSPLLMDLKKIVRW